LAVGIILTKPSNVEAGLGKLSAEFVSIHGSRTRKNKETVMELSSVGDVIAERTLTLVQGQGPPSEIIVLLGKPQKLPDHSDYYCPYQIKGSGPETVRHTCGVDRLQALQLALSTLAVDLELLNNKLGGGLRWNCGSDNSGDFGFPVTA
jgi:hypothetical protein